MLGFVNTEKHFSKLSLPKGSFLGASYRTNIKQVMKGLHAVFLDTLAKIKSYWDEQKVQFWSCQTKEPRFLHEFFQDGCRCLGGLLHPFLVCSLRCQGHTDLVSDS